jgi:hypothetical protein
MPAVSQSGAPAVRPQAAPDTPLPPSSSVAIEIEPSEAALRRMPGLCNTQATSKWFYNLGQAFASGTAKFVRQNCTTLIGAGVEFGFNYLAAQYLDEDDDSFVKTFACTGLMVTVGLVQGSRAGATVRGAILSRHPDSQAAANVAMVMTTAAAVFIPMGASQLIAAHSGVGAANSFIVSTTARAMGNSARDGSNEFLPRTGIDARDLCDGEPMDNGDALRQRAGKAMLVSVIPNAFVAALGDRVLPDAFGGGAAGRILADGATKGAYAFVNEGSRGVGGEVALVTDAKTPDRAACERLMRWFEDTSLRTVLGAVPQSLHAVADHLSQPGDATHTTLKVVAYGASAIPEWRWALAELNRQYQREREQA